MNRIFRTTIVETSGVRTIAGGGTNASDAGQALLNLGGAHLPSFFYDGTDTTFLLGDIPGSYAAYTYENLTQVYLGHSVTTIGSSAFQYNSLTSVTIPNSVTTIGSSAFQYNSLTSVTIPNSVTTIGSSAFQYNSLTSVTIPNSVTTIGSSAFAYNSLTGVTIGNSVTTIGSYAFRYNSLTSVTIPNSVTTIGSYAFRYNSTLVTVNCYAPATAFTGIEAFYKTYFNMTLNVRASDGTWTAGGQSFQGTTVNVVKNL